MTEETQGIYDSKAAPKKSGFSLQVEYKRLYSLFSLSTYYAVTAITFYPTATGL
jgi:hypothetical protein